MSVGVPIKILNEAEGHVVTCETITGEIYRGMLIEAEENMNCQIMSCTVTQTDGRVSYLPNVFIRGPRIRFLILPDILKSAPMFTKVPKGTAGRQNSAIHRAQAGNRRRRGGPGTGDGGPGVGLNAGGGGDRQWFEGPRRF